MFKIHLDRLQAMKDSEYFSTSKYPPSPSKKDFDMICDIRSKVDQIPIKISWQWVQSHQDDLTPYSLLPPVAQDNINVNKFAKWINLQISKCTGSLQAKSCYMMITTLKFMTQNSPKSTNMNFTFSSPKAKH